MPTMPPRSTWVWLVDAALDEDLGPGDATSLAVIPADLHGSARIETREPITVSGLEVAREVFHRCDVVFEPRIADGRTADTGEILALVQGSARGILAAERTALNFLQRLSGIATLARRYCDAIAGTRTRVLDTRKTTPGWRHLEKYAVRCGGAANHRCGLFDGILIKDNHIRAAGSVTQAVERARAHASAALKIRVEVESGEQARDAIESGADALLIDNQPLEVVSEIVALAAGRVRLEASGGVHLDTIGALAHTGVDEISVGALTHSARAVDIALEWNDPSAS